MKAKPNDMQADQTSQPAAALPVHTKARAPAPNRPADAPALRIGRKLQVALRAIVWEGQDIAAAAKTAGLTGIAVRVALAKPHVIAFLRRERQVFVEEARAQNIHHAVRVRASDNGAASMRAVDFLEHVGADQSQSSRIAVPGIVIRIGSVEKALNSPANVLELQAQALPSQGEPALTITAGEPE